MASIQNMRTLLLRRKDRGATTADHGLAVAPVAAAIVTAVPSIGTKVKTVFTNVPTRSEHPGHQALCLPSW